ncbi:Pkinase-domain-containing protein, partial [Ramicandelaber brevisporus]
MAQQQQQQQHLQPCNYRISRTLGSGSYATVKEAIHIVTGQRFAAKVINKRLMQGKEQLVRNEITVLKKVSHGHPNVLTMYDYFESTNNLYLILELCTGPELFNYIVSRETFFERDAARMMRDIVDGVSYLHDNGIVHRDLKPENIMFKDSSPESPLLIADFGLSRILETEQYVLNTLCGTRGYMSPEIIKRRGHGKPVDIWALGVIAYFILSGIPPFDRGQDLRAEEQAIVTADYRFEPAETHWNFISFDAKDFINKCLVIDPAQRMTAKSALAHTWLRQVSP